MPDTVSTLDSLMERASRALAEMDYLACEVLCLEALEAARCAGRYGYYARVLLPLQEARRHRRMIAAQGEVLLGSGEPGFDPERWLAQRNQGCILLTPPHRPGDAKVLADKARAANKYVEVLYAEDVPSSPRWTLRSYDGPEVCCEISPRVPSESPASWFLRASELLGDAALGGVDDSLQSEALVLELQARLRVFPDHERLHQRLAGAARLASRPKPV